MVKRVFRILATGVNAILLGLWLTGFASAYVNPSDFWIGALVAIGLPFVTLALLPFAVAHALSRKWFWLSVHVVVLILAVNRHWSPARMSLPDPLRTDRTLMTFNSPRHPDTDEARERVDALVEAIQPDMIALQESVIWAARQEPNRLRAHAKFRTLVDSMNYATTPPRYGPEGASWVRWEQPVLSLHPIESQDEFVFDSERPGTPPLHVLRTEMDFQGRKFAHYNVHLFTHGQSKPWNGDGDWARIDRWLQFLNEAKTAFGVRAWETERVRGLIEQEELPVILSGDFNVTADDWTYMTLSEGLQDAFRIAGEGWGATYHSNIPLFRIDFVLLGPEFEVVRARVPDEFETASDHHPLVVRFRWKDGEG